ncbi:MAG: hypothetical protein WC648_05015 [Candidatus Paceibacterota bacterium]
MATFTSYRNTSSIKSPTFVADPNVPSAPNNTDLAARLSELDKTTSQVYDALIQAGKIADANALAIATRNMKNIGGELGLNQMTRMAEIKKMETALNAAAMKTQSEILMQKAQAQASTLNQLTNMRQQDFANAMSVYNAQKGKYEQQQQTIETQNAQQNAIAQAARARMAAQAFRGGDTSAATRLGANTIQINPSWSGTQSGNDWFSNWQKQLTNQKAWDERLKGYQRPAGSVINPGQPWAAANQVVNPTFGRRF